MELIHIREKYIDLLQNTSENLIIKPGWIHIVDDMCLFLDLLNQEKNENIFIFDIQKKFGVLNIIYKGGSLTSKKIINFAEKLSYSACEECGEKGSLHSSDGTQFGKLATLCSIHALLNYKKI